MENNEMTIENLSKFDQGINQAINGVVRGDIRDFQNGFEQAIDARIVERISEIKNDGIVDIGYHNTSDSISTEPSIE